MTTPLSPSQLDMRLRFFENRFCEHLARIHDACNANGGQMPLESAKALLACIDNAMIELAVGPENLSPLHYELSSYQDRFREHILQAIKAAEEAR